MAFDLQPYESKRYSVILSNGVGFKKVDVRANSKADAAKALANHRGWHVYRVEQWEVHENPLAAVPLWLGAVALAGVGSFIYGMRK